MDVKTKWWTDPSSLHKDTYLAETVPFDRVATMPKLMQDLIHYMQAYTVLAGEVDSNNALVSPLIAKFELYDIMVQDHTNHIITKFNQLRTPDDHHATVCLGDKYLSGHRLNPSYMSCHEFVILYNIIQGGNEVIQQVAVHRRIDGAQKDGREVAVSLDAFSFGTSLETIVKAGLEIVYAQDIMLYVEQFYYSELLRAAHKLSHFRGQLQSQHARMLRAKEEDTLPKSEANLSRWSKNGDPFDSCVRGKDYD